MNAGDKAELDAIIADLNILVRELESIASGVNKDFIGIGNAYCSNAVYKSANNCSQVRNKLKNIDTEQYEDWFLNLSGE